MDQNTIKIHKTPHFHGLRLLGYRFFDNWFGYRFFEVVRSMPRSIPHYRLSSSVAQLVMLDLHFNEILAGHIPSETLNTLQMLQEHQYEAFDSDSFTYTSARATQCLFRKCPPFNTPRYPPVQYLPFNTPVQYPIEQKAAAYPPGTGGFDTYPCDDWPAIGPLVP